MISLKTHSQKAWIILGLLAFGAAISATPAVAQSSRDITSRLSRIENELDTLNRAVYKGETPPASAYSGGASSSNAATEVRIQQLETQLRELQGRIEEQNHSIDQMKQQLERSLSDFEMRLGGAGGTAGAVSSEQYSDNPPMPSTPYSEDFQREASASLESGDSVPAPQERGGYSWSSSNGSEATSTSGQLGTISESGAPTGSRDDAAIAYEEAFSQLKASQYEDASQGFENFIKRYPNHALVPNAKYWLGESYYVQGEFETAARIFAEGYQQYPKAAKAADNLLKLGMSLSGLGKNEDACIAYGQLEKDFAGTAAPVMRRAKQEMERLACA